MSDWITHRRPTDEDADDEKCVWTMCVGKVVPWGYEGICDGQPWMPTNRPKPYVKPKRCLIFLHGDGSELWKISMKGVGVPAHSIPTYEAAERIAAIYEEVMP